MKRTFKKLLAWVLAVVMMVGVVIVFPISVSATQSVSSGFNTGYTLTGDGFTDMVNIAMAQNERTQAQIGYSESWCADFVSDCARLAGQESAIPFNGVVQSMYNAVINAGGYQISSPQAGDLVFFYNSGSGYGHVGIALDDSRNISGNIWYNGQAPSKVMILQNRYEGYGNWVFVRPNYTTSKPTDSEAPTISDVKVVDVSGESFTIQCELNDNVGVTRVWLNIYGPDGSNGYSVEASNGYFSHKVNTSDYGGAGNYSVHIYAFDAAGNETPAGISFQAYSDTEKPIISNAKAVNCSDNSFTVQCDLYDNVGVTRVWLNIYGPGGSNGYGLEASNGFFSHTINTSDYGGAGDYTVHIYAFDAKGNETPCAINGIKAYVDYNASYTAKSSFNGHTYEYYEKSLTWDQAYKFCEKKGGHLVTVNSADENAFLISFTTGYVKNNWMDIWIGGKIYDSKFWITGEPFNYENWDTGEPNNLNNSEDTISMLLNTDSEMAGKWHDTIGDNLSVGGFICEYEDVDASKYTPVYKQNYNGHEYWFFEDGVDWQTAKKICEAKGGYLVIIDNAEENSMVNAGMKKTSRESMWIGITDIAEEGVWRDVKGNLLQYTNWHPDQPDNYYGRYGREDYGMMYPEGNWNDANSVDGVNSNLGFVCEFEFLCAGLGHDYQLTNHTDATCTTDGENIYTCSRCGDVKTEIIQATGHSYTAEVVEPTCTEQGYTVHTCTKCGDTYQDSYTDALGHQYQEEVIASTETEQGYTLHTCTRCGDSYKDHYTEKLLGNASTISATAVESGKSVQITAKASGGSGYYQYAVYYKKSTSKSWTTLQDFGTNTKVTFKPAKKVDYLVLVKVKDSTGAIVGKTFTVSVNAPLKSASTVDKAEIALRESVTLKGAATGGVGAYQYAYYYKKTSEESWKTLKTFSDKAQVSFKPTEAGTYDICIKVKDGNKTTVKSYFQLTVSVPENTSKLYPSKIAAGKTAKVYCSATGGTGFFQYAVYYKPKESDKWTKVQAYDANTTVTFKPPKAGTYDVSVMVKDSAGNVVKKYFTLTVT